MALVRFRIRSFYTLTSRESWLLGGKNELIYRPISACAGGAVPFSLFGNTHVVFLRSKPMSDLFCAYVICYRSGSFSNTRIDIFHGIKRSLSFFSYENFFSTSCRNLFVCFVIRIPSFAYRYTATPQTPHSNVNRRADNGFKINITMWCVFLFTTGRLCFLTETL